MKAQSIGGTDIAKALGIGPASVYARVLSGPPARPQTQQSSFAFQPAESSDNGGRGGRRAGCMAQAARRGERQKTPAPFKAWGRDEGRRGDCAAVLAGLTTRHVPKALAASGRRS
jgi:hypothetical protein